MLAFWESTFLPIASFKIDKISEVENKPVDKLTILSDKNELTNVTSNKPIKLVENIYSFSSPNTNSGKM